MIRINSSGTLNFVNKLVITVVYDNASLTTVKSQPYVWTIVYDYAGTKLIHALFKFTVPSNVSNIAVKTTINFELYSTGLFASAPYTMSQTVTVLI